MKLVIDITDVFVIFDSHSRPSHPDGAVFILNTSIHRTAARLKEIFPVDRRLLSDSDMQWQAQLLANYSGHIFVSKGTKQSPAHFTQTVVESSLAILALRAEVSDLKLRLSILTSENERLQAEVQTTEAQRGRTKPTLHHLNIIVLMATALVQDLNGGLMQFPDHREFPTATMLSRQHTSSENGMKMDDIGVHRRRGSRGPADDILNAGFVWKST